MGSRFPDNYHIGLLMESDPDLGPLHDAEFWEAISPSLFEPERLRRVSSEVASLRSLLGPSLCSQLERIPAIDLGCARGHFVLELGRQGLCAIGVDIVASFIAVARKACDAEGLSHQVHFICDDALEVLCERRDQSAFMVTCLFTTLLGYGTPEDDERLLQECHRVLHPDGRLVIESATPALLDSKCESHWEGLTRRIGPEQDDGRRPFTYELSGRALRAVTIKVYQPEELRRLATRVGFSVELFADFAGANLDDSSGRFVAVLSP